jgi:hypothetical protein
MPAGTGERRREPINFLGTLDTCEIHHTGAATSNWIPFLRKTRNMGDS